VNEVDEMKIKRLFPKIPFCIFCISMILLFCNGLAYPEETNYWIVTNGVVIMFLEFISLFSTVTLFNIAEDKIKKQLRMQFEEKPTKERYFRIDLYVNYFALFVTMFMALYLSYLYNIWLFIYFIITNAVKFYGFKQTKTISELNEKNKYIAVSLITLILSSSFSLVLLEFVGSYFHNQLILLQEVHNSMFPSVDVSIGWLVFWGIFYFIFILFFDFLIDYWEYKTGKSFAKVLKK